MFEARGGVKELSPPQRRRVLLRLKEVRYGQRRHKFKRIFCFDKRGNGVSPSFSQNPKQVLFMPEFWCVRRKILRHQCRLPCRRQILGWAPQLPAPCTFPSMVWASSWVPCTFSSATLAWSWALSAPFLRWCRPQAGFFCCLSYGHVKVLRKNKVLKQQPTSPLCHLLGFILFSCTFLFDYVISFDTSWFQLSIVRCTISLF